MTTTDQDLLGNSALYRHFRQVTEVLGKFVACTPRTLALVQLEQQTARPARELRKLCDVLCREQLLRPDPGQRHCWRLACEPSRITLEDAFRCAVALHMARTRPRQGGQQGAHTDGVQREVELLMMQAMMGINQSVSQHLRRFSLDRLKAAAPSRDAAIGPIGRSYLRSVFS